MNNCECIQNKIINEEVNIKIIEHIKECKECKTAYDMMHGDYNNVDFLLADEIITKEVNKAFSTYEKTKRLKDIISFIIFISFSTILLLSSATIMINIPFEYLINLGLTFSGFLPVIFPVIVFFRKRKVAF